VIALALALPRFFDRDDDSATTFTASPKSAEDRTASAPPEAGGSAGAATDLGRESTDQALSSSGDAATSSEPALPLDALDPGATTTTVDPYTCCPLTDLGHASDLEGLAEPARRAVDPAATGVTASTEPAPPTSADATCLHELESIATTPAEPDGTPPSVILRAAATVGDEPVVAVVVEQTDGSRELLAARTSGCDLLGTVAL
jgi:hypothetical protein